MDAGRILVADDEEKNRRLLCDLLTGEGYTVRTANDGMEALQLAVGFKPEAILLDIMMPKLNGVEACRRLKADPATASIPILLATALHDRADRMRGLEAGANDFLTKPLDAGELRVRVRNAIVAKRLHDGLQEAYRRLQELEQLRDNLTGMIVHDMRSPLMVISGSYEIIQKEQDMLSPDQKEFSALGQNACRRLTEMVNSLLDISRMEAGEMPLNRVACDIREIVRTAVESVDVLAREKTLTLRVTGAAAGAVVDRDIVHRIFVNLLGNAIKFSRDGGTIEVDVASTGETIRTTVTDRGRGIPPEYHERIFEKFGQVGERNEGRMYSTGLGLTFCKLAVEAHGGRIGVESEAGEGSTFWFVLPRSKA